LLRIKTYWSDDRSTNKTDAALAQVVRQNKLSKTQSVSSFQWASILLTLADGDNTFDVLMKKYNEHPEVVALGGADDDDKDKKTGGTGAGSIALTGKMKASNHSKLNNHGW
jgi:hypothetical protein